MVRAMVGETIGRFVVEAEIGAGGMGRVYRALDPGLGRRLALKVLVTDGADEATRAEAAARMSREARAAAAFTHPNVVAIYEVGELDGAPFIAMELVSGATLRAMVGDPQVSEDQKLRWLLDIARGLAAAHRAGLVHRDIKPENVMVTTDGVVKVLDFGIARRAESEAVDGSAATEVAHLTQLTADGLAMGTPSYMAPEQLRATALDGRCDQYAWGVTAYELFAGALPWQGRRGTQLVAAILEGGAPPLRDVAPSIDPRISDVIARAMEPDRQARFASMGDLIDALAPEAARAATPARAIVRAAEPADATAATTAQAVASTSTEPTAIPARRSPLVVLGAAVVALALAAFVGSRLLAARHTPLSAPVLVDVAIIGPLPDDMSEEPPRPWSPPRDGMLHMWSSARDHGHRHNDLPRYCKPFSDYVSSHSPGNDIDKVKAVWLETPTEGLPPAQVDFCRSSSTMAFGREDWLVNGAMPDAVRSLLLVGRNAGVVANEHRGGGGGPLCPSSSRVPVDLPLPGRVAEVQASDWADPGWSCIRISRTGKTHFQYWFETTPTSLTAFGRGLFLIDGRLWRVTASLAGSLEGGSFLAPTEVEALWETVK
jgi:hypothetical protein